MAEKTEEEERDKKKKKEGMGRRLEASSSPGRTPSRARIARSRLSRDGSESARPGGADTAGAGPWPSCGAHNWGGGLSPSCECAARSIARDLCVDTEILQMRTASSAMPFGMLPAGAAPVGARRHRRQGK